MSSTTQLCLTPQRLTRDPRISAALEYVAAQPLHSVPTVRLLAQKFNISESYLRHKFRDVVGLSFGQYVKRLRFERARHLLKNSSLTVKQAMLEVGMLDHSSFAKSYRKYFGETPTSTKLGANGKWKVMLHSSADDNSTRMEKPA